METLSESENKKALEQLGSSASALVKTSSWINWDLLTPNIEYRSNELIVWRVIVDELDNIHIRKN